MSGLRSDFTDDAPIVQEAFAKLPYPRNARVAQAGMQGVAGGAWKLLQATGPGPFSREDFRKAVDVVIQALIGAEAAGIRASESRPSSSPSELPEQGAVEHTVTLSILRERGLADSYTQDDYVSAFAEAERRLGLTLVGPSSEVHLPSDMRMAFAQDPRGLAIHRERCELESRLMFERPLVELDDDERLTVFAKVGDWA